MDDECEAEAAVIKEAPFAADFVVWSEQLLARVQIATQIFARRCHIKLAASLAEVNVPTCQFLLLLRRLLSGRWLFLLSLVSKVLLCLLQLPLSLLPGLAH